jgi:hypothetical protein
MNIFSTKNYSDLEDDEKLSYDNLLKTVEWDSLRKRLFSEANYTCSRCSKEASKDGKTHMFVNVKWRKEEELKGTKLPSFLYPTILHLHHTYYVRNTLPWEYPESCFKVVCGDCHGKIHEEEIILMYPNFTLTQSENVTPCDRCNGLGYLSHFHYVEDGVCFKCKGAGFNELLENNYNNQANNQKNNDITSHQSIVNEDDDLPFSSDNKDWDLDGDDLPF